MEHPLHPLLPRHPGSRVERLIRRFFHLEHPGDLRWHTYFWTALSGGCFCASSFVLLALIVRLLGEHGPYWGGVFSIALAISQQLITIGLFQMRPFQVSDIDEAFTFSDYFTSRVVTVILMVIAGGAWMFAGGMGHDKSVAILLLLTLRAAESFSDVFEGRYQQFGRLDIASKGLFFKTLLPMGIFGAALWLTRNMLVSLAWMAFLHWLLLIATDGLLIRSFARLNIRSALQKQKRLLLSCLPLATNAFLFIYLNNLSRYAIDQFMDERKMAEYNALFMPSFLIVLLSSFVLRPALTQLSRRGKEGDGRGFRLQIYIQLAWVAAFTAPTIVLAYAWGTPALTLLYGIDLTPHRNTLCILIAGGAMLAVYYIFQSILIILRRQMACLVGILLAAAAGRGFTPFIVRNLGIPGGAVSFLLSAFILSLLFMAMTAWYTRSASLNKTPFSGSSLQKSDG